MYLQIDPLYNLQRTSPIQAGGEMSIASYANRQFGWIYDSNRQSGSGSVLTRTRTESDSSEPLVILTINYKIYMFMNSYTY